MKRNSPAVLTFLKIDSLRLFDSEVGCSNVAGSDFPSQRKVKYQKGLKRMKPPQNLDKKKENYLIIDISIMPVFLPKIRESPIRRIRTCSADRRGPRSPRRTKKKVSTRDSTLETTTHARKLA